MSFLKSKVAEYMANIGTDVPFAVTLLIAIVSLIISTRDLRVGILFAFIMYALEFIVLRAFEYDTTYAVAGIFLTFAFMTLSLLIRKSNTGVY